MSLKENFYQALRELLNYGGLAGSDLEEKAKTRSELDSYLETPLASADQDASSYQRPAQQRPAQPPRPEPEPEPEMTDYPEDFDELISEREAPQTPPRRPAAAAYGGAAPGAAAYAPAAPAGGRRFSGLGSGFNPPSTYQTDDDHAYFKPVDEMTVISKNTLVDGNIRSFANITVNGSVRGRIDVMKDASMHGMLVGDLICGNVDMQGSSVQGNVTSKGRIYVDNDSLLLGDVDAQYASVDGRIKGNMEVGSKTELHQNAVVAGDIQTGTIAVEDGANIKGFVNTSYMRENSDSAFPSQVVIDDAEMRQ